MKSFVIFILSLLAFAVILVPAKMYYDQFHKFGISDDTAVWGQLGDYLNVWVSMASLILLGGLTFYLHSIDKQREDENRNIEEARSRPYLVVNHITSNVWKIKNIGNGPAMNIKFAIHRDGQWGMKKKMESLMSNHEGRFDSAAVRTGNVIGVQYYDIHDKVYSTLHEIGGIESIYSMQIFLDDRAYQIQKNILKHKVAPGYIKPDYGPCMDNKSEPD